MPVRSCTLEGKPGFKWGDQGKCYTYEKGNEESLGKAKQKAIKQGIAIGEFSDLTRDQMTPPKSAQNNAKKAIEWKEKHGNEVKGGTQVGWTRANQLAKGGPLSKDIIKRMAQFNRHRKNAEIDPKYRGEPWKDNGHVAWLLWGGTSGVDWAIRTSNKFSEENMEFSETLSNVEIFKVGTWNGHKFVKDDLEKIVANSNKLIDNNEERPPLKLGHSEKQIIKQSDGQPALGWINNLRVKGDKIIADLKDVPNIVANAMKKKLYNKVSVELAHSKHFGYYTTALSLLGADLPAVKGLEDLNKYVASDLDVDFVDGWNEDINLEPVLKHSQGVEMDEKEMLKKIMDRLGKMEDMDFGALKKKMGMDKDMEMNESMYKKMMGTLDKMEGDKAKKKMSEELAEAKAKLAEYEEKENERKFSEVSNKLIEKLEKDVKEGCLQPAVFAEFKETLSIDKMNFSENKLSIDHEAVIKLSDGYKEKLKTEEVKEGKDSVDIKASDWQEELIKLSDKKADEKGISFWEAQNLVFKERSDLLEKYNER